LECTLKRIIPSALKRTSRESPSRSHLLWLIGEQA
jgi:hypothetical protein